jgi:hypothetical protein
MASVQIGNSIFPHNFSAEQLQSALAKVASANQAAGDLDEKIAKAIHSGAGAGDSINAILFGSDSKLHSARTERSNLVADLGFSTDQLAAAIDQSMR